MLAALSRPVKCGCLPANRGAAAIWPSVYRTHTASSTKSSARICLIFPHTHRLSFRQQSAMAAPQSANTQAVQKTLHLLRHGETEMNVFLAQNPEAYEDPLMYDTILTARGEQQAAAAAAEVQRLSPPPELVICSPLTRALQTAELAFQGLECDRIVSHWATERLYHASDVGKPKSEVLVQWSAFDISGLPDGARWHTEHAEDLKSSVGKPKAELLVQWLAFDISSLPDGAWWHTDDAVDLKAVSLQTDESFDRRMDSLRAFLLSRPERSIALVSHWGVLAALSGRSLRNAEFHTIFM